ncbi:DegV family protein [Paenibacillus sp. CAU 1782]
MGKVRIVTDSTSDIPAELKEGLDITVVPLQVLFGEETFLDSVTLTADQFYAKLKTAQVQPTTSQPSPLDFSQVYERLLTEDPGCAIISIHLASVLSGTHQSATIAKSMLEQEGDIEIVDSCSASYGIGMQVVLAARMAKDGKSKEEILDAIRELQQKTYIYFLVDSLEWLRKGGRIGKAAALIGSILNIKPILSLDKSTGSVIPADKARGTKKAIARIGEMLQDQFGNAPVAVVIAGTDELDNADELEAKVKAVLNVESVTYTTVGAVIGTHTGPGTSAVFAYKV